MTVTYSDYDFNKVEDIELAREQLEFAVAEFLRRRKWVHSSSHPGALWLWSKRIGKRSYHVPMQSALAIEAG